MNRGGKAALLISCAGLCGCSASTSAVKLRALADPAAAYRGGGDSVALARGQLMIGNVGLALEGFRKAQRDNPSDPAALAGLGDCYAAMSRFDLAQSNYEAALALSPRDPGLLLTLASVFDREGLTARALAARAQAKILTEAVAPVTRTVQAHAASVAVLAVQPAPVTIAVQATPAARTVQTAAPVAHPAQAMPAAVAIPIAPAVPQQPVSSVPPIDLAGTVPPVTIEAAPIVSRAATRTAAALSALAQNTFEILTAQPGPAPVAAPVAQAAPSVGSITVKLPPARPAEHVQLHSAPLAPQRVSYDLAALSSSITVPLPPARPTPAEKPAPRPAEAAAVVGAPAPRLERLSRGEVALVTRGKPIWTPTRNLLAAASSVRWVALEPVENRPNVRILNAARTDRLAASARTVLLDRGWRKIAVGDAPATQDKSVVLYSKNRATLGRRLAAQFGVAARMVERDVLVLVLGRDAVDRIAGQQKS